MRIKELLCSVSVAAALGAYTPSAEARGMMHGGGFMMMRMGWGAPVFVRPAYPMPVYQTYYVQAAPQPYCAWYYGQLACWNGQQWYYPNNYNWQGNYNQPAAPAYNSYGNQTAAAASPSWRNDLGNMAGAAGVGAVGGALANRALNGVESRAVAKGAETVAVRGAERVAAGTVARTVGAAAVTTAEETEGAEIVGWIVRRAVIGLLIP